MDFISEIAAGNAPQEYPIKVNGKEGSVFVRRLTGQQKLALARGKKYAYTPGTSDLAAVELDLETNERDRHQMVQFCLCDEAGKARFKTLADVQALPAELIEALYKVASAHNKNATAPDEEPGEA